MSSAKTYRPNREPVLDIEGGSIDLRDIKAARDAAAEVMGERAMTRLMNRIIDLARDDDTSMTRAARDRVRATPRDESHVNSSRLRAQLPSPDEFRKPLSGRQRKLRSAVKNRVMAAAPGTQHRAVRTMLTDNDPAEWRRINRALHNASGDVQQLSDDDRVLVQRLDRVIQSSERLNDRDHRVYVSVALPDNHQDVDRLRDIPRNMRPGATLDFDQFTLTRHNLHETPGHDSPRHLIFEIVTSRGAYLGRSDTIEDTTHLLPRGMQFEVVSAEVATYATPSGYGERIVIQLREKP